MNQGHRQPGAAWPSRHPSSGFARFAALGFASLAVASCGSTPPNAQTPGSPFPPPAFGPTPPPPPAARPPLAVAGPEASSITFERMSRWPEPGGYVPRSIAFSPDGKWVTFLQSEKLDEENALYLFDRNTKETRVLLRAADLAKESGPLSREEELRRERQRQKIKGITSYHWAKRAPLMVIPSGGDVFVRQADGKIVRLTSTPEPEIDARPCDTGEKVAFVRKGELFVVDVASKAETQLTRGAAQGVTRGLSDFNGQEEFGETSGYWWSPKCDRLAYLEVDERQVEQVPVVGYRDKRADVMMQRYPAAGGKNPIVKVGMIELASRRTTTIDLPAGGEKERYVARFAWGPDGRALYFQTLTRDQRKLELVRADVGGSAARVLTTETSPSYVEFAQVWPLEQSQRVLFLRNRGGYRHIDLLDATSGSRVSEVTAGNWDVESIAGVDEEQARVLFTATKDSPLDRQLYVASLAKPADALRLTLEPGKHEIHKEERGAAWVDLHSAFDRPPHAVVHDAKGVAIGELPCPLDPDFTALRIRPPDLITVRGPSGDILYGSLLRPRQMVPGQRYPVVVMVYGGPHVQTVQNKWNAQLVWQHLADRGVVVFQLDNRGTPGRGRAFEQATYGRLGELELQDQLAGLDYLATLPFVDPSRVGIYGHSYGGFMSALAMLRAPTRFKVGIAGSPVTDWHLYDTGYTERFMGLPDKNASGYQENDLSTLAPALKGKLFILHAMMDENVHFQNSARLIDALTVAQKPFDLLLFPGERHGYRNPQVRQYAEMRIIDYLVQNL
jgi:dipeptidyl-peptidase-4